MYALSFLKKWKKTKCLQVMFDNVYKDKTCKIDIYVGLQLSGKSSARNPYGGRGMAQWFLTWTRPWILSSVLK